MKYFKVDVTKLNYYYIFKVNDELTECKIIYCNDHANYIAFKDRVHGAPDTKDRMLKESEWPVGTIITQLTKEELFLEML